MFAKSYKLKSNNTLKNSEKKHLAQRIKEQFPNVTDENVKELVPNKSNSSCMKINVHSGELVNVYIVDGLPIIIEDEKGLVPTICALWKLPDLVPTLIIHEPVLSKVLGGVPLYLPGLYRGANGGGWAPFSRGSPIAVCCPDNRAAALVGRAALSSSEMQHLVAGVCLETIQTYGDQLCKDIKFNKIARPSMGPAKYPNEDLVELTSELEQMNIQPVKEEWPSLGKSSPSPPAAPAPAPVQNAPTVLPDTQEELTLQENIVEEEDAVSPGEESAVPPDMEGLLRWSVLVLLRTARRLPLPLHTNLLYKNYLMPLCPPDRTMDVKKSSYKKLSNFLDAMQQEGLLEVRELEKGVWAVTAVCPAHPAVRALRVSPGVARGVSPGVSPAGEDAAHDYSPPAVRDMYCVTAAVTHLLPQHKKGTALTPGEVRAGVVSYVKEHNLDSGSSVVLDATLAKVLRKQEREEVRWEAVVGAVRDAMTAATELRWADGSARLLRERLQPISCTVATRSGNKKVTLVSNLESFGFVLPALGRAWQTAAAARCAVTRSPGARHDQLLLQGDQTYFVAKTLIEKYGLPKKFVEGADKALKKKK